MTKSNLETIFHQTFTGIAFFIRDTSLPARLIQQYKPGTIIMERGFVDLSYLPGGLASNLRYLVATASARDLSQMIPAAAQTGHVMLPGGAFFKVLDVYAIGKKTQVTLLHIPEEAASLFASAQSDVEERIIREGRTDFEQHHQAAPNPALQSRDWKERTKFPLGMDSEGNLFFDNSTLQAGIDMDMDAPTTIYQSMERANAEAPAEKPSKRPWWKF